MTNKEKKKLHRKTIKTHRKYVRQMCFKMGIPLQGLIHDLSKYSKEEFEIFKYYTGTCSPHQEMRNQFGYSDRWMYHYHKNKHHWQYWLDIEDYPDKVYPIKMPYKYVIESICDFVGAGMAYSKEKWTPNSPWEYWELRCKGKRLMHPDSEYLTEKLLWGIKELGLEGFLKMYNNSKKYLKENYENGTLQELDRKLEIDK